MAYEKQKDEQYQNFKGINEKASEYTTGDGTFLNIRNYTFEKLGSMSSRPGQTYAATLPISFPSLMPKNIVSYVKQDGSSHIIYDYGQTLVNLSTNTALNASFTPNATTSLLFDAVIANNFCYLSNGYNFVRTGGTFAVNYRHVPFITAQDATFIINGSGPGGIGSGATVTIPVGTHRFVFSGARSDGTTVTNITSYGPFMNDPNYPRVAFEDGFFNNGVVGVVSSTLVGQGLWFLYGITFISSYGYSAVALGYVPPGTTTTPIGYAHAYASIYAHGPRPFFYTTVAGVTHLCTIFEHITSDDLSIQPLGEITRQPSFLEYYNNMLFMAGFSGIPNRVDFSDVGMPEEMPPENFFEVQTADGDKITGMAVFQDALLVFKNNSFFEVTGNSPDTISVRQVNTEYGSVNNTGIVVFENRLLFVDEKGVVEYDGSNVSVLSDPIEPTFLSLNKTAIRAKHLKEYNQVWFMSDTLTLVYDYVAEAWTFYDGFNGSIGSDVFSYGSTLPELHKFSLGQSVLNLGRFSASVFSDFGSDITLISQTKFHKRQGDSTQELWRRFYLNKDPGPTLGCTVNFIPDYGASVFESRSMPLGEFQTRIDLGISAKSMSVEWIIKSQTKVRINGYTIESRYLRSV